MRSTVSSALRSPSCLGAALALGLVLPFLGRPPHIDDPNFLRLAAGARLDPWRPHAVTINWGGTTERAFEVLSNPPGVAWWLAPALGWPLWAQHLWMLPWLGLALWGAWALGRALTPRPSAALLVLGTSPALLLAAQGFTPDLPLAACALAGVGGFLRAGRGAWAWAVLAGCAALFRYSGVCLVPLLVLAGWQRGRPGAGLWAALPTALLALHDLHAYGQWHLVAMTGFQSVADTPRELLRKGLAAVAMLGGAVVLPLLALRREAARWALGGLGLGALAVGLSGQQGAAALATALACLAGALALSGLRLRSPEDRLLAAWALGGLAFLLTLRFAATRYWLAFYAAPALALLRLPRPGWRLPAAVVAQALLTLGLAVDEQAMARAQHAAAARVATLGQGRFAGHWGWQGALEAAGWVPLEEGARVEGLLAVSAVSWPQQPAEGQCLEPLAVWVLPDTGWGPRAHSAAGAANLHAFLVSAQPPVETYAPWTLADDPYDEVTVLRSCSEGPPPAASPVLH